MKELGSRTVRQIEDSLTFEREKAIWLAATLDHEGCIQVSSTCQLSLQWGMKTPEPIDLIQLLFRSGSVTCDKRGYYRLTYYGPTAVDFLRKVEPFLLEKGVQARFVIEFFRQPLTRVRSQILKDHLQLLRDSLKDLRGAGACPQDDLIDSLAEQLREGLRSLGE